MGANLALLQFLSSVLSSIETGDPIPTAPPAGRNPAPGPASSVSKANSTSSSTTQTNQRPTNGQKRRAEDDVRPTGKPNKVSRSSSPQRPTSQKPTPTSSVAARALSVSKPEAPKLPTRTPSTSTSKNAGLPSATPAKPPPKGSYAEMMLRAKALQEKAPTQLGIIKHHSVSKEKQLQQKRKAMEAKQKGVEGQKGAEGVKNKINESSATKSSNTNGQQTQRSSAARAALLKSRGESEYKGTARPPPTPSAQEYKGTSGLPSRRASNNVRANGWGKKKAPHKPVRDEYLGTDEEDEGEFYDDYDERDYYSDESTDMEAGLMDVEEEEQRALRVAKLEDEKELQAELAAKREKMERKKKLAALTKSRR
ncbi:hypothetical protein PAAG_04692 [Paracoccidioides lutzii Pb01]|uniref:SPT2 chromatin protein n=1 Tax=Paracoccidioides lutzii (strain ATCC MYA-826 / Pb01) TaxID=502779 RepID=C1H263_PARBA|nr:hypothetical protein PAAG_04692 [Paracoccidioides lutzii Pb01]EEH33643.2 hypothetical protein PAAG_04692 [Paracoccidioides lutzii Pb01]